MATITVDRNTGIPPAPAGRPRKYPFPDMRKGDSFVVDREMRKTVSVSAYKYGRDFGRRFTMRLDRTQPGKVRVTRIH